MFNQFLIHGRKVNRAIGAGFHLRSDGAPAVTADPIGIANGSSTVLAQPVGFQIKSSVGTSAGAATVSGVSEITNSGSAAGVATANGQGRSIATAVGISAGVATAVGQSGAASSAVASGSATVTGEGKSIRMSAGTSAGVGAATGDGKSIRSAVGTAAGSATVYGTQDTIWIGISAGVATASGQGRSIASSTATAAGVGAASGQGRSIAATSGASAGVAAGSGQGRSIATATGTAAGAATVAGESPSDIPALVWSSDMNIDNDDVQTTAVVIDGHRKGIFRLVGVMVASGKRTGAPAMRAILDAYGLEDVPIGVKTTLTQTIFDFYPTRTRDLFGKDGETDADYPDCVALYRQLAVDNPGMYIAVGGTLTCESAFMDSAADGISGLTGSQLITAQEVKLFCVGGRIGLTANEPNFNDDVGSAANVCNNWPEPIVFGAIPSDFSTLMTPVRVRIDESRAVNPARYAFSRGAATVDGLTLNDPSGDIDGRRNSGDTMVIEEIIDEIQGNLGATYTRTATGKMIVNTSTLQHTFSEGTAPNKHRCLASRTISGAAQQTKIQGWLDALDGPSRVNLWKKSTSLYGASDNSAVLADGTGPAPDGTTTACTVTGGGWAGHTIQNIISFPSQEYCYVAYMKKTSGRTRFPAMTIVFKSSSGNDLIAEAGGVINTNTGVGYPATGGSAPSYGSHACTIDVQTAPSTLGANYNDWWEVVVKFTTPANTQYINIYIQSVAGNNATSYTRDGSGASNNVTVWGMGLYPEAAYAGYLPTVERPVFREPTPAGVAAGVATASAQGRSTAVAAGSAAGVATVAAVPVGVLWTPANDATQPLVWIDYKQAVWSGSNLSSLPNMGSLGGNFGFNGTLVKGAAIGPYNAIKINDVSQYISLALPSFGGGSLFAIAIFNLDALSIAGLVGGPGTWGGGNTTGLYAHITGGGGAYVFGNGWFQNAPYFRTDSTHNISAGQWYARAYLLGPTVEERLNGQSYTSGFEGANTGNTPTYAAGTWKFGNIDPNSPGFEGLGGDLAHLLLYNVAPGTTLKEKLEAFGLWDIGQQSRIISGHTYKDAAPTI